jgi:hypothetical protein
MPARIPRRIRENVVTEWLKGIPRAENAKINGIGSGTVTKIIQDCLEFNPEFVLLHEVAIMIRKGDMQLTEVATSIRLKRILNRIGLDQDKAETFLENLSVHCFKSGLKEHKFIDLVNYVGSLLDNLGMRLEEIPSYISKKNEELSRKRKQVEDIELKEKLVVQKYGATMEQLEQYMQDKPLLDKCHVLQTELQRRTRQTDFLREELSVKESEDFLLKDVFVSEHELERASEELDTPLDAQELYRMARELFSNPSNYSDIIKLFREHKSNKKA